MSFDRPQTPVVTGLLEISAGQGVSLSFKTNGAMSRLDALLSRFIWWNVGGRGYLWGQILGVHPT